MLCASAMTRSRSRRDEADLVKRKSDHLAVRLQDGGGSFPKIFEGSVEALSREPPLMRAAFKGTLLLRL